MSYARIEQPLKVRREFIGVSMLQRKDADVAQIQRKLFVQLGEQAVDDRDRFAVAGDDQRLGAFVDSYIWFVFVTKLRRARTGEDVVHHFLECRGIGVFEGIDPDAVEPGCRWDIKLIDRGFDERERICARGDDQEVCGIIGLNDQRGAAFWQGSERRFLRLDHGSLARQQRE